jgi:predicted transcriptional regulator
MKSVNYSEYKKEMLKDPELKAEYDKLEEEFTLASEIIQLRKEKNITQKELAERIGTSQPAIARLESGSYNKVSLSFLRRVAEALDAKPEVHLRKKVHS